VNGGPTYWIRNIAYHLPGGSTRLTNGSAGVLFYNNTILSETTAQASSNIHWRNNLFLGENTQPVLFDVNTFTSYTSSDYNGFRPNPNVETSFQWSAPASGAADFTGPKHQAALQTKKFATLAAYAAATGQDKHSVIVDYDVFVKVPRLDRNDLANVQKVLRAEDFDFRLKRGSAAVDRGVVLPNVSDRFTGQAPDLGAIEEGEAAPHYGSETMKAATIDAAS
jgi:hypothetical protein